MEPALDISLNMYIIRIVVVLIAAAGAYFLRQDKLRHVYEVIVHNEGDGWSSSDSLVVGGIIFAVLFLVAPGMGDTFLTEFLGSFLGVLTAFSMRMEMNKK